MQVTRAELCLVGFAAATLEAATGTVESVEPEVPPLTSRFASILSRSFSCLGLKLEIGFEAVAGCIEACSLKSHSSMLTLLIVKGNGK